MSSKILKSQEVLKKKYPFYEMSIEDTTYSDELEQNIDEEWASANIKSWCYICLLYTSPSPRDLARSRMPSSA